ncbi:MAG TPA: cell division protein FtsA [Acidobacteriota bacterium]|nr:cell division protein FtsA [Acidobacteriota bacterium]
MKKESIICGLDVGTTKMCMMVGKAHRDGGVELVGTGYSESKGLSKGVVVNLDEAAASIRKAADEAELKSGISINWVTVGAAGDHFKGINSRGALSIEGKRQEVTAEDIAQVISAAQAVPVAPDREIVHVLAQEFFLDDRGGIMDPEGLYGSRLAVNVHLITGQIALNQNLINAVTRANLGIRKVVFQQLASAEAVLTRDERELGAMLIDIGGGTTDIAVYSHNAVQFTRVLPVGGAHFTRDLAIGLRTSIDDAERIKKESGTVLTERVSADKTILIPGISARSERSVSQNEVCTILRDRAAEILELVGDQIRKTLNSRHMPVGVVLTGGGSLLDGIVELTEDLLGMPARQGLPMGIRGLPEELSHPVYSTALGLALMEAEHAGYRGKKKGKKNSPAWLFNRILSWAGN